MIVLTTHSVAETEAFGESLATLASPGWIFGLSGDLGAGKTALVRGLARGLGVRSRVHSPTFALLNEYAGAHMRVFHLDLYRLKGPDDVRSAGLEEYLSRPDGVSLVEWVERWCGEAKSTEGSGPGTLRRIHMRYLDENSRQIGYDNAGA